jgi:hypothetical protein
MFDRANLAVSDGFSEAQGRVSLEAHSPAGLARLHLMKITSDFREAMWGSFRLETPSSISTSGTAPPGISNPCGTG